MLVVRPDVALRGKLVYRVEIKAEGFVVIRSTERFTPLVLDASPVCDRHDLFGMTSVDEYCYLLAEI